MTGNFVVPTREQMDFVQFIAKAGAETKFFTQLGGIQGIVCIALYALELGLPPMQCLMGGMWCINGRVVLSAQMMNSMVREKGHEMNVKEHTHDRCILWGKRKDTGEEMTVSYSFTEAKEAGLVSDKSAWSKHKKAMVFKTCVTHLCKWLFADVIGTAAGESEIEELKELEKEDKKSSRTLPNAEILTDREKTNEELRLEFYAKFDALETEKGILGEYLNTSPDPYGSIRKALADPSGFEKIVPQLPQMLKRQKEKKQADATKQQVLKAMASEVQLMPPEQLTLEMEMANKSE